MRSVLVTGSNKGIGYAVVKGLATLGYFVFLGSRDINRGQEAVQNLESGLRDKVLAVQLDVESDESVNAACKVVRDKLGDSHLYGIVNNAGTAEGLFDNLDPSKSYPNCVGVNFMGTRRVTEAFMPLLDPVNGRIVNTSSASGPNYVSRCSAARQKLLCKPDITMKEIDDVVKENLLIATGNGDFAASGYDSSAYGFSKALVNAYTQLLARENPKLCINAATPGFIATDLTKPYGSTAGMKTPTDGAKVLIHCLTEKLEGNGWYYGSDCVRSPLDRYRSPGDPPYDGK